MNLQTARTMVLAALLLLAPLGCPQSGQTAGTVTPTASRRPDSESGLAARASHRVAAEPEAALVAGCSLGISVWNREVAPLEPVLVRVDISNPTSTPVSLAPPGVGALNDGSLVLELLGADGRSCPVDSGYYGDTCPWPYSPGVPPSPQPPLVLAPGEAVFRWIELLQCYAIDEPGRYHLVFHYRSDPARLTAPDDPSKPSGAIRVEDTPVDAGWLTVREPTSDDQKAAEIVRAVRGAQQRGVSSANLASELAEVPGSVHAWWDEAWNVHRPHAVLPSDRSELAAMEGFVARNPDFPLNYQVGVLRAAGAYALAASRVDRFVRERAGMVPRVPADRSSESEQALAEALRELDASREIMLAAASGTKDYHLYEWCLAQVWGAERWRRWPVGSDGRPRPEGFVPEPGGPTVEPPVREPKYGLPLAVRERRASRPLP